MNSLDKIAAVLGGDVFKGYLPDKPDTATAIFEYSGVPPNHHFGGMDIVQSVQVRTRSYSPAEAYSLAETAASKLNRYYDGEISVLQATAILDIGYDSANPQRQEYTVNFTVRTL